jgi:Ca-activated chloride channel family protein
VSGLFRDAAWLWAALAALAGAAALLGWSERRRRRLLALFAQPETLDRIHDPQAARARLRAFKLEAAALALLLLALAGPQWGVELVETQTPGAQVVVAVDVSLSMLAEDMPPSRMDCAKRALATLVEGLKGARVGVVAFAGQAHVQCPLTADVDAAKSLLARVQVGLIPQPGTELGKAIDRSLEMLARSSGRKTLVVLTDGEDLGQGAEDAAARAAAAGVRVFILGAGTPEGGPIPLREGAQLVGYKKDESGKTVVSRIDEPLMMKVAAAGGGDYARLSRSENEVGELIDRIESGGVSTSRAGSATRFRNRFRFPLALSVLLLAAALLLPPPSPQSRTRRIARAAGFLALALLAGCSPREDARLWKGNRAYRGERFADALESYARAAQGARNPKPLFNAGDALYRMKEHERAAEAFTALCDPRKVPRGVAAAASYNLGNTLLRQGKPPEAVDAYRRCLLLSPDDEDCRHNLAVALKKPPQPDPKQQDKQKDKSGGGNDEKPSPPKQQSSSRKEQEQKGGMSREDAERVLQAVKDREKAAQSARQPAAMKPDEKSGAPRGKDW